MLRKEASISATVAELHNTITIDNTKVTMIAQPATAFKLLQVLNHWIDNINHNFNIKNVCSAPVSS
jgi:hypothetical protein